VCPGELTPAELETLRSTLARIGAKPLQDRLKIDTTHFVCSTGSGALWERANELNIPVVRPEWVEACEKEGRVVGVRGFYLGADVAALRRYLDGDRRMRPVSSQSVATEVSPARSPSRERKEDKPELEKVPEVKEDPEAEAAAEAGPAAAEETEAPPTETVSETAPENAPEATEEPPTVPTKRADANNGDEEDENKFDDVSI